MRDLFSLLVCNNFVYPSAPARDSRCRSSGSPDVDGLTCTWGRYLWLSSTDVSTSVSSDLLVTLNCALPASSPCLLDAIIHVSCMIKRRIVKQITKPFWSKVGNNRSFEPHNTLFVPLHYSQSPLNNEHRRRARLQGRLQSISAKHEGGRRLPSTAVPSITIEFIQIARLNCPKLLAHPIHPIHRIGDLETEYD